MQGPGQARGAEAFLLARSARREAWLSASLLGQLCSSRAGADRVALVRLGCQRGTGRPGTAEPQSLCRARRSETMPSTPRHVRAAHSCSTGLVARPGDRHVHRRPDGASAGVGFDSDSATAATRIAATRIAARIAATRIAGLLRPIQTIKNPNVACERGQASWATPCKMSQCRYTHTASCIRVGPACVLRSR